MEKRHLISSTGRGDRGGRLWIPCLVLVMSAASLGCSDGPRARFDKLRVDLGAVDLNEQIRASVVLQNAGGGMLKITKLRTTCRCLRATISKSELGRKEEAAVAVVFDGSEGPGDRIMQVYVSTNDPRSPLTPVSFVAHVMPGIALVPSVVCMTTMPGDGDRTRVVDVIGRRPAPEISVPDSSKYPWLAVEFVRDPDEGPRIGVIRLRLVQAPPEGVCAVDLQVRARLEGRPVTRGLTVVVGETPLTVDRLRRSRLGGGA